MNILITGGAGFIGLHLARALHAAGHTLYLVDNFQRGRKDAELNDFLAQDGVTCIEGDLTQAATYQRFPEAINQVYHLAAMVGVKHCMESPDQVLETNLRMTQELVNWLKTLPHKPRLLFASTSEIYAGGFSQNILPIPTPEDIPVCIEDLTNPRLSYAVSKLASEMWVRFHAAQHYAFQIIRFHNIYGPRMGFAHVIPELIKRIREQERPFKAYGHDQTRAFCFVEDAVSQMIAVMNHKVAGEVFNIGNDQEEIPIQNLIEKLFALMDYQAPLEPVEAPPGSVKRRCPDTQKVQEIWSGSFTPLDQGLKVTLDWYLKSLAQEKAYE